MRLRKSDTMYELHPTLQRDTVKLGELSLCDVLLMNNALTPWVILVPRRHAIREAYELSTEDQAQLSIETNLISATVMRLFQGDKLNVAAIGNIVPQLHVHVVVRYTTDPAWPAPVWGNLKSHPYTREEIKLVRDKLQDAIAHQVARFRPH